MLQGQNSSSPIPCSSLLVPLAAGDGDDFLKDLPTYVFHGGPFENSTGVDVHVVDHAP